MYRYNRLLEMHKIAVNKENEALRKAFEEKFSDENPKKNYAIADQWWRTFNNTPLYKSWKDPESDLKSLNDVIRFIKENKDSVERGESKETINGLEMLSGIYPEFKNKFSDFNERFLSWLVSRYGENSKHENLHPIDQAISTLSKYQEKMRSLRQKFDSNKEYKDLFNSLDSEAKNPSDIMKLSINDMEAAIGLAERPRGLHTVIPDNYKPKRFLGQFGPWKLWLPESAADSIAIAGYNKFSMLPDTDWCTGRTFGHNLFYSYTTNNTFLFYAIKDGATKGNLSDYQSIGLVGSEIVYPGDGSETVDGNNNGMYEEDHRELFGDYFGEIYNTIYNENRGLNGVHPVQDMIGAAALGDEKAYEDLTKIVDSQTLNDIKLKINDKKIDIAEDTNDPELIEKFYNDESLNVKMAVASNPHISIEMIEDIFSNAPLKVKAALVENDKIFLPENIHILKGLAELRFDDKQDYEAARVRFRVAGNSKTPDSIIKSFFMNEDDEALGGYITGNPNYTEKAEGIFSFFKDEYEARGDDFTDKIFIAMAASELTPVDLLERIYSLAKDSVSDVYFLRNKNATPEILMSIYERTAANDLFKLREITRHPNANKELLDKMMKGDSILSQVEKAENYQTPIEELERISESKHLEVLEVLSKNPKANTEIILKNLIKYVKFKPQIARRGRLPKSILDILSRDKEESIRREIAKKINIGREILLRLSTDSSQMVRAIVYNNPSTPIDIVLGLSEELYHSSINTYTGNRRVDEHRLNEEAFEVLDNLYNYQSILLNDGINLNQELYGDSKNTEKVDHIAKRIAEVGSIVFYDADLTELDLTKHHSNVWAKNFINKNTEEDSLSRDKKMALSLAKEIVQESEDNQNPEQINMANDKLGNLVRWLSKSGYKKEAADIFSIYKEATLKIKMSPLEVAVALGLLSQEALPDDSETDDRKEKSRPKKKDKEEKDAIENLLKELREFDLEKEAAKKKKKKKSKKKKDRTPTKPELWSASKAWAKRKYDVWPSAYAVGAALKRYKEKGGGWRGPKSKK